MNKMAFRALSLVVRLVFHCYMLCFIGAPVMLPDDVSASVLVANF